MTTLYKKVEIQTDIETVHDFLKKYDLGAYFEGQISNSMHKKIKNIINGRIHDKYKENYNIIPYIGVYYQYVLNDTITAEKYFVKAAEKGNIIAIQHLAELYYDQKKYDLVEKYLKIAVKKDIKYAICDLAKLYETQNRYELAIEQYKLAIEKGQKDMFNNLGFLYQKLKKYDLAIEQYKLGVKNGIGEAMNNLGFLYQQQDKLDLAEEYYKQAVLKNAINAHNNLGFLYQKLEKFDLAITNYKIGVFKNDVDAPKNLINLYKKQDKMDLAIEFFKRVLEAGNNNVLVHLANLYRDKHDTENSSKYYLLAIATDNSNSNSDADAEFKQIAEDLKQTMPKLKLYHTLNKIAIKNNRITNLMIELRKSKEVHCFVNKQNFNYKTDTCLICQEEETKVIPYDCAHFYCVECYSNITKCQICGF